VPTTHAFISLSLLGRDDHDRAGRVVRDLVADRSEQEAAEATDATRPHDDGVGTLGCVDDGIDR
jgi:hypothetical protein